MDRLDPQHAARLLQRAEAEVAAGRPWAARRKLRTWLAQFSFDPALATRLGELELEARELPAAGRWFWLVGSERPEHREAIAVFRAELGDEPWRLQEALPRSLQRNRDAAPPEVARALAALAPPATKTPRSWRAAVFGTVGSIVILAVLILGVIRAIELIGGLFG